MEEMMDSFGRKMRSFFCWPGSDLEIRLQRVGPWVGGGGTGAGFLVSLKHEGIKEESVVATIPAGYIWVE
jgi:hypothetical protein